MSMEKVFKTIIYLEENNELYSEEEKEIIFTDWKKDYEKYLLKKVDAYSKTII